jgi:hypothetical protein
MKIFQVGKFPLTRITSKNTLNYFFMSLWEKFEQLTGYEHEPLAYKEYRECIIRSRQCPNCYNDNFFLTGLKRKYEIPLIQKFLYRRFDIDSLVHSVRRRKLDGDGEKQYDVLVFFSSHNACKILLWEKFYQSFLYRKLYSFEFEVDSVPSRYFRELSSDFLLFVKQHLNRTDDPFYPNGKGLNGHLENYCETLGLPMPDD